MQYWEIKRKLVARRRSIICFFAHFMSIILDSDNNITGRAQDGENAFYFKHISDVDPITLKRLDRKELPSKY